jgi:hypothetical protein
MDLGGPVWHASAAPLHGIPIMEICRAEAYRQLTGVGDAGLGEWTEWTGRAFHLLRRLSAREQRTVGPVVDIRGTDEARMRVLRLGDLLRLAPRQVLLDEAGIDLG